MNYFDPRSAAERYARGRPYFHPRVMGEIREHLGLGEPVGRALDVGCGTGLSCRALGAIAREVVGVDVAREMVAQAERGPGVAYAIASAERLPFGAQCFDLATVSSVLHWLDRAAFLAEARRVLRPGGWMVVYENAFTGQMAGVPESIEWTRGVYLRRYPSPPRHSAPLTAEECGRAGFEMGTQDKYTNEVRFTLDGLVEYLLTQSNTIVAIEGRGEPVEEVRAWLRSEVEPLYAGRADAEFGFTGTVLYMRRSA